MPRVLSLHVCDQLGKLPPPGLILFFSSRAPDRACESWRVGMQVAVNNSVRSERQLRTSVCIVLDHLQAGLHGSFDGARESQRSRDVKCREPIDTMGHTILLPYLPVKQFIEECLCETERGSDGGREGAREGGREGARERERERVIQKSKRDGWKLSCKIIRVFNCRNSSHMCRKRHSKRFNCNSWSLYRRLTPNFSLQAQELNSCHARPCQLDLLQEVSIPHSTHADLVGCR